MKGILRKLRSNRSSPKEQYPSTHVVQEDTSNGQQHSSTVTPNLVSDNPVQFNVLDANSSGTQPFNFDIVAIHGLGGDMLDTWTHVDGTLWLRDILPAALPGVRVFSYGYPSSVFFSSSTATIQDYALHFLDCLRSAVMASLPSRPIVYICHSLGGIVFKQAMNLAPDSHPDVWLLSQGVLFFGTPHRGSFIAEPAAVLGAIFNVASLGGLLRRATRTSLLRELQQNSNSLLSIGETFIYRTNKLQIVSYHETQSMPGTSKVVVEASSASIGVAHERRSPMYLNHRDICKFGGQSPTHLIRVINDLKHVAKSIGKTPKDNDATSSLRSDGSFDVYEKECIKHLNKIDLAEHISRFAQPVEGTLQWVPYNTQYKAWLSEQNATVLCVTGYAGCGKTTLSSYISERLLQDSKDTLICRFFFDGKRPEQKKAASFLRSLVHQIVKNNRKLIKVVKRASELQGPDLFDQFDALWDLFNELVRRLERNLCIVIDAVDECERDSQQRLIDALVKMLRSQPIVKILMTTRPDAPALFLLQEKLQDSSSYFRLSLEKEQSVLSEDINIFIRKRMDQLVTREMVDRRTRDNIENILVSKVGKTFLWISIVLSLLEKDDFIFLSYNDLLGYIEQLPSQLVATYRSYLESIPASSRRTAGNLLRIIVASTRPLNVRELQVLYTIKQSHHTLRDLESDITAFTLPLVQKILGPLVTASDLQLELIHYSLREYLIDLGEHSDDPLSDHFGVDTYRDSLQLAQSCMWYLSLDNFQSDIFSNGYRDEDMSTPSTTSSPRILPSSSQDDLQWSAFDLMDQTSMFAAEQHTLLAAKYPFYDYAATQWGVHFGQSNSLATDELHNLAMTICDARSPRGRDWFSYFWTNDSMETSSTAERFPENLHPLSVASYFGQNCTVKHIIECSGCDQIQLGNAIYWAAQRGHAEVLQEMLARKELNTHLCYHNEQSPLMAAASYGHLECVQCLIHSGYFDINEKGRQGLTSLAVAARGGHTNIVHEILALPDNVVDVNVPSNDGSTPLFWAVSANSTPITKRLRKDVRTDLNHRDHNGRTALVWAVIDGLEDQVKLLVQDSRVDIGCQDRSGRTPLIYAAKAGCTSIVRLLLRTMRASPHIVDKDGRNAVSFAAGQSKYEALHALLTYESKHGGQNVDVEDTAGWNPLAWALDMPGYAHNVSLLLQSGYVDVNRRCLGGRSALSYAAGYGLLEITQTLTRTTAVDLNSKSWSGRTPISYAASGGYCDILRVLIEQSIAQNGHVDLDQKDNSGRTPLSWAKSMGYNEAAQMLLDFGFTAT